MESSRPVKAANPRRARLVFRAPHRLSRATEFRAVYAARVKKASGAFVVFGTPNARAECRLGLAVGRRAGPAVTRNRIKRLIREAFRLLQHELPASREGRYDLVVSVREPVKPTLESCQAMLSDLAGAVHREWERRGRRAEAKGGPGATQDGGERREGVR